YDAQLTAVFGKAFALDPKATTTTVAAKLQLAPAERRTMFYELAVGGDGVRPGGGKIAFAVDAANLRGGGERTVTVATIGFPQEVSMAGTLKGTARHEVYVSDVLPGTMRGKVTFYPSPLATMEKGTEAMIAEPSGCFEQASSTTYPNIMILG